MRGVEVAGDVGWRQRAVPRSELDQRLSSLARLGQLRGDRGGTRLVVLGERIVDRIVEQDRDVDVVRLAPARAVGDPVEPAEDLGDVRGGVVGAMRLAVPGGNSGASSLGRGGSEAGESADRTMYGIVRPL